MAAICRLECNGTKLRNQKPRGGNTAIKSTKYFVGDSCDIAESSKDKSWGVALGPRTESRMGGLGQLDIGLR